MTQSKNLLFVALLSVLFFPVLRASAQSGEAAEPVKRCGTHLEEVLEEQPEYREVMARHQAFTEQYLRELGAANKTGDEELDYPTASKYVIPCVVHVIWGAPDASGRDSLSESRVRAQFVSFFEDFRNVPGTRGYGSGDDTGLEFALATIDPEGRPTNGINWIREPDLANLHRGGGDADENDFLKTTYVWDQEKYFNIWLTNSITTGDPANPGNLAGYGFFPGSRNPEHDGIVVIAEDWGTGLTPQFYSSTPTHEVGHWVNLFHPFQGGCGTDCAISGDLVCDTPPVATGEFKNPNDRHNTCRNGSEDKPDNTRYYMDYIQTQGSLDRVCNAISREQSLRAQVAIQNPQFPQRFLLWQESNLEATGTGPWGEPRANFWASKRNICVNQPVTMLDYSMGCPSVFEWRFEGGTPATSTDAVPEVSFAEPGSYDVTLVIRNQSGRVDSVTKEDFIIVEAAGGEPLPYLERFSDRRLNDPGEIPSGWYRDLSYEASFGTPDWEWRGPSGYDYNMADPETFGAFMFPLSRYSAYGQLEKLRAPAFDLSTVDNAGLSFKYAYAPLLYENTNNIDTRIDFAIAYLYTDTLRVQLSRDCGVTWETVWQKGGEDLMTIDQIPSSAANGAYTAFAPTSNDDWGTVEISLDDYVGETNVYARLELASGFGNDFYIDNFSVMDTTYVSTEDPLALALEGLRVSPNPTTGLANFAFELDAPAVASVRVFDMTGRSVAEIPAQTLAPGASELTVDLGKLPSGVYSAQINLDGRLHAVKLIRQ